VPAECVGPRCEPPRIPRRGWGISAYLAPSVDCPDSRPRPEKRPTARLCWGGFSQYVLGAPEPNFAPESRQRSWMTAKPSPVFSLSEAIPFGITVNCHRQSPIEAHRVVSRPTPGPRSGILLRIGNRSRSVAPGDRQRFDAAPLSGWQDRRPIQGSAAQRGVAPTRSRPERTDSAPRRAASPGLQSDSGNASIGGRWAGSEGTDSGRRTPFLDSERRRFCRAVRATGTQRELRMQLTQSTLTCLLAPAGWMHAARESEAGRAPVRGGRGDFRRSLQPSCPISARPSALARVLRLVS
jgi:hypothetical protein